MASSMASLADNVFQQLGFSSSAARPLGPRKQGEKTLTDDTINPAVKLAEYAVRGEIALKAEELRTRLATDSNAKDELRFDKVVSCNIGNPQQLGQQPLTFGRQLAALTEWPDLLDKPETKALFPSDVVERARQTLEAVGSIGAYSHSKGVPMIRQHVAEFLHERDGVPAELESIFLTAGASAGVSNLLQLLISSPSDGVLIPIPQYPLYTAALTLNSARPVEYYLDESAEWQPQIDKLKGIIDKARSEGTNVKAMVVISPGNPVGNVLSVETMQAIVKFCYEERLVLMADEVYQTNIFDHSSRPFVSFKKVVMSMGAPYADDLELISFHSISKGQTGECGRRGGYFEAVNLDPKVIEHIYKLASIQLCPPLSGQIGVDVLVKPPKEGEPSYDLWKKETDAIHESLKYRSEVLAKSFNELDGVSCNKAQGAMYLFPRIEVPKKAFEAAEKQGKKVDAMYCMELLEETGICIIPGSGFGQEPDTLHFRTTFLAPGTEEYVERLKGFHSGFLERYRD